MCERPPTNMEMHEYIHARWNEHYSKVERDGCCGQIIRDSGTCPETGKLCPCYQKAMQIEKATFKKVVE